MNKNKGFTLIELLVVIAIIGILASVVLASLNTARNKGADAAVKSNLANARAQAEIFYDSNSNSYDLGGTTTDVCDSTASTTVGAIKGIYPNVLAAATATGAAAPTKDTAQTTTTSVCNSIGTAWAAAAPLKAGGSYCVDSLGTSKVEPAANLLANTGTVCL
jgi:prepilin-type N-terminal cleavage/methylation domain-containing protein